MRWRLGDAEILLGLCSKEILEGVTYSILRKRNMPLREKNDSVTKNEEH